MVVQGFFADEIVAALRRARQIVAHQIQRDAVEPGGKLGFAAKALVGAGGFDERLLRQVFGFGDIADVLDDETLQARAVFPHQVAQQLIVRYFVVHGPRGAWRGRFLMRYGCAGIRRFDHGTTVTWDGIKKSTANLTQSTTYGVNIAILVSF